MLEELNYTNQIILIHGKHVKFKFRKTGENVSFNVSFNFDNLKSIDSQGKITIIFYSGINIMKFSLGTVENILYPQDTNLYKFKKESSVLCIVKITDRNGNVIARMDRENIKFEEKNKKKHKTKISSDATASDIIYDSETDSEEFEEDDSIFPVANKEIGNKVWAVDFDGDKATLLINKDIDKDELAEDPVFQYLILPAAFEKVLKYYLLNGYTPEDNSYLKLGYYLVKELPPDKQNYPKEDFYQFIEEMTEWINMVIDQFCSKHNFAENFITIYQEGKKYGES